MNQHTLLEHMDQIHTTDMGKERIQRNLKMYEDVVEYCKQILKDQNSQIYKKGKNYYLIKDHIRFTINASSYTIITAHVLKKKRIVVYIHGKGGNIDEALHYQSLFDDQVIGFDYTSDTPYDAIKEFKPFFETLKQQYDEIILIANSIGAYFALNALNGLVSKAYFISPVVDMKQLIEDMMMWANVSEEQLKERKNIETDFNETLSLDYYQWVKEHPIHWGVPTHILYGSKDHLQSMDTIRSFVSKYHTTLTILEEGEHWFHTSEQMAFLDQWILEYR